MGGLGNLQQKIHHITGQDQRHAKMLQLWVTGNMIVTSALLSK
jgi:hypothetical protein